MERICQKCKKSKNLIEFLIEKRSIDGYSLNCKECIYGYKPKWFNKKQGGARTCIKCKKNKDENFFHKRNDVKNSFGRRSVCIECSSLETKLKKYNLTKEEYEQLLIDNGEKCQICDSKVKLCIDHSHETNRVRGILCNACNTAIGLLGENTSNMLKAIEYLNK